MLADPIAETIDTSRTWTLAQSLKVAFTTAIIGDKVKLQALSLPFYALVFGGGPFFLSILTVLIYRDNHALRDYAIVAGAGTALLFSMLYSGGETLEGERVRGTLGGLFISPAPRYAWLLGFQLGAVIEAIPSAIVTVLLGVLMFGTTVSINGLSLLVTVVLLIVCMSGFGMIMSAIGSAVRNANQLSNMIHPMIMPLAGTMFPIAAMPLWLRIPARCLPFGYGMQALVASTTANASLLDLRNQLLPLAGFAIVLPLLGVVAFRRLDRYARIQGHLEMV